MDNRERKRFAQWAANDARAMVQNWEGLSLRAYKCPAGIWTIGYGSTKGLNGRDVLPGSSISRRQAEELLTRDICAIQLQAAPLIEVEVTSGQHIALLDFIYNVGIQAFSNSTLRKHLNAGRFQDAAYQFKQWKYSKGKELPGLIRRRAAEMKLFQEA